ncbi:membrane-bound lytic murein transglycosylase D [Paucibacter oligotrophus]|uniref:Membrane-bound lytic murein transglycosylase D n=1 Tax=Roseateles oligotrophus TaxID=1769250 RepID=A0A840L7E0_9BURK|nr:transglycosylase SLT domain-containing protein [Roseateles oligotrophus]MBB4843691.1 membrane-bound lytic murein transglycosylase D [Roseateles oligotrophus]
MSASPQRHFSLLALIGLLLSGCASTQPGPTDEGSTATRANDRHAQTRSFASSSGTQAVAKAATPDSARTEAASGLLEDSLNPGFAIDLDALQAREDLWVRVRGGFAMADLDNDLVRKAENWYSSRPDYVDRMTERGSRYLFHIIEEVNKRDMPAELALLPFIESAFNPQALSSAKASGMWQFMPVTGKDFALKQNIFRDDRRDVLASTRAALDYLGRLHKRFGDWHLALAAYNWGQGNVQRAIDRNLKAGLATDYESLRMPDETRYYVPKLQAVKNIVLAPEKFNLRLPPVANHPYFLSVNIDRDMDVAVAARLAGLSVDEFKQFNPQMNKPVMLAAKTTQVLLPYDNASAFALNLAAHRGPLASWTAWVVPRTMKSAEAARQVGMPEAQLLDINKIPPRMLVKQGSTLLVSRTSHRDDDVSEHLADNASLAFAPDVPPLRRQSVKAGKGDTVAAIAARYRVSAAQVAQWNKVGASARFKPGQMVVVYTPVSAKASTRSAQAPQRSKAQAKGRTVQTAQSGRTARPAKNSRPAKAHSNGRQVTASAQGNGESRQR